MNKPNVLIFSEDFPPKDGGIAQWAMGVARSFHKFGFKLTVLTRFWSDEFAARQQQELYPIAYARGTYWKKLRTFYARKALKEQIELGNKPDVIIATTSNIARGLLGLVKSSRAALVVVVHGLEVTRKMNGVKQAILKKTLHAADRVVAVSRFTAESVVERYQLPESKIFVLPNGVDPEVYYPTDVPKAFKEKLGIEGKRVILTLARLQERKGHDKVIEALPAVLEKVPHAIYLVSGKSQGNYYERLVALVERLGVKDAVKFIGYVQQEDMNLMYNSCDVYIMPSREIQSQGDTEGFGITYLEANACAKPVIGGRSGGVVDAVLENETGFLVPPSDVKAISESLITLLTNDTLANKMGKQARKRVETEFSWENISQRLAEELHRLNVQ